MDAPHSASLPGLWRWRRRRHAKRLSKSVPFTNVHVQGGLWGKRLEVNRTVSIPVAFRHCEDTGRIGNFTKAARQMPGPFRGLHFDDSDVYKIIEGASYSLAIHGDEALALYLDQLIAKIGAAQEKETAICTRRAPWTWRTHLRLPDQRVGRISNTAMNSTMPVICTRWR